MSLGQASAFTFKHTDLEDPPFFGSEVPIYKDSDKPAAKPQETPFFNSRQFHIWDAAQLEEYNKLINVLIKWRDKGWCEFTETAEWIPSKENWVSWVKYYTVLQIPAEDMHLHLYEIDIMRIPTSMKEPV